MRDVAVICLQNEESVLNSHVGSNIDNSFPFSLFF